MITRTGESPSPALRYLCDSEGGRSAIPPGKRSLGSSRFTGLRQLLPSRFDAGSLTPEGRCELMIKWNYRATRVALVLGAIAAFAIASGAQTKWQ